MADVKISIDSKHTEELLTRLGKNVEEISGRGKRYVGLLSAIVYRDLIEHFERQEGPEGRWAPWSEGYKRYLARVGKSGNMILIDTGRLRQGWQPSRYRLTEGGVLWFNPVSYGANHEEGIGVPRRRFAWLSDRAVKEIEKQTARFVEDKA